jgi:ankyrin repeat protein
VFLEYNADPNRKDRSGTPPLVKAADEGWFEGFELLLECGADPNSTDDKGKTALDHVDNFRPKKNTAAARKRLAGS